MDLQVIIPLISQYGLPMVGMVFIYMKLDKAQKDAQIKMEERIQELKDDGKEDKVMFNTAINSFNNSVQEFKTVNCKMTNLELDIREIKNDLTEIKSNTK